MICAVILWSTGVSGAPPEQEPLEVPTVRIEGHRHLADDAAPSTVISREQMTDAMADLPEVLDEAPGLRVTRLGGLGSYSTVSVRGSTNEQVLIFVDGIPLNSAEGGPVNLANLPLGPVDTVVIYRGISPVRFGGSAIGGVVSIHTRELDEPRVDLEAGAGDFGTRLLRGFVGVGGERWSAGASVDYLGSNGDFEFTDDNGTRFDDSDDRRIERRNNAFDQVATLAKAQVILSDELALRALNLVTWRRSGLAGRANLQTREASLEQTRVLSALRLEGCQLGGLVDLTLTGYVSWSETRLSDPLSEIGLGADSTRDVSTTPGATALLNLPIAFDDEERWTMRLSLSSEYRFERFTPGDTTPGASAGLPSARHFATAAGELDVLMEPIGLELVGSLRWERAWSELNDPENLFGRPRNPVDQNGEDIFTWRAALIQRSIPYTELSFNVSRSVRFPSLFELFGNTGAVLGNPLLQPEVGLTFDGGILHRAGWLPDGNTWTLEAHVFHTELSDLIQFTQNSQGISRADNVDSATVLGVEVGTYADVVRHVRARFSATWLDTENTGAIKSRNGKQLPLRPELKIYAQLTGYHRFDGGTLDELGIQIDVEHLSGNYLDSVNLVELPERTIWGIGVYGVMYDGQIRADLGFRNLGNTQVIDLVGYPLPGFSVMATVRYTPNLPDGDQSNYCPQDVPESAGRIIQESIHA